MQIGMVGLGRMGLNMARRLLQGGHEVIGYDRSKDKVEEIKKEGANGASSLEDLINRLQAPRVVWLMLPAGQPTEETIDHLAGLLGSNDLIVEGGNSYFQDDQRRAAALEKQGIRYVDAGVSGGIWGLTVGYCTMAGGDETDFGRVEPAIKTLAPENGYLHCGPVGSGHFVKMVHNGIEYALMEGYAEGFELLKASEFGDQLNMKAVAHLWNQGSVIRSWLLELLESAFSKDPGLKSIQGYVEDSGEGRWTVEQAIQHGVPLAGIAQSLFRRFRSRQQDPFAERVLAALRREFGGHAAVSKDEEKKRGSAGAGGVQAATPSKEYQ